MNLTSEYFQSLDLTIYQPEKGHRYGVESLALADFVQIERDGGMAEFCSGVGIISLIISKKYRPSKIVAIEIQSELHEISLKNISENQVEDVVEVVCCDYRGYAERYSNLFNHVVVNPPFYAIGTGRMSSDPQRAQARHEINGTLDELLESCRAVLKERGKLSIVFPKLRGSELLDKALKLGFRLKGKNEKYDDIVLAEFQSG